MCQLCQKYGGSTGKPTTHNTKECRRFDQNGNQLASFAQGQLKNSHKSEEKGDILNKKSYAQIAKAVAKVLSTSLKKPKKKRCIMYVDDDSDSSLNSSDFNRAQ